MIQSGSPFNSCADIIAFRLVSLHTVCNPWIYLLTRKQYRKAFCYIIKMPAYFITCKSRCVSEENLGKCLFVVAFLGVGCCNGIYIECPKRLEGQLSKNIV